MCSSVFRIKSSSQPTPQRTRYASHPASACSSFASGPTIRPNRGGIKSNVEGRRNIIDVIYSPPTPKVHRPLDLRNLAQHVVCLSLVRNSKIESCTWTPVSDSNDGSCRNQPLRRPSLTIRSSPDFLYVYSHRKGKLVHLLRGSFCTSSEAPTFFNTRLRAKIPLTPPCRGNLPRKVTKVDLASA